MPSRACVLPCIAVLAAVFALGCNLDNPGDVPPRGLLYFPNVLALSKHESGDAARYLLVANSDFDLRYKTGTLQALSLDEVQRGIDRCRDEGDTECLIDTGEVLADEVAIGAFSTALAVSADGETVFSATRTDDQLGFTRFHPDASGDAVFDCGSGMCPQYAKSGADRASDGDDLAWPSDPVSMITGPLGDFDASIDPSAGEYVIVAHRAGDVSLFVRETGDTSSDSLRLVDTLPGLAQQLTGLALDPQSHMVHFSIESVGGLKLLARVGVVVPRDDSGDPDMANAFLYDAGVVQLDGVSPYRDTRDLTFVPPLADGSVEFSRQRALVVSRAPSALLLVDVAPQTAQSPERNDRTADVLPSRARVDRTVVVGAGASRLVTGSVGGRRLAVVSCFDSREVFVIDLRTMLTSGVVPNLSGPFDLALDEERQLAYVADFRSSVIRIIDLSPLNTAAATNQWASSPRSASRKSSRSCNDRCATRDAVRSCLPLRYSAATTRSHLSRRRGSNSRTRSTSCASSTAA